MKEDYERKYCPVHKRDTMHLLVRGDGCIAKVCVPCLAKENSHAYDGSITNRNDGGLSWPRSQTG